MKEVPRIIAGLVILTGIVFCLHWLGRWLLPYWDPIHTYVDGGVGDYILVALMGFVSILLGGIIVTFVLAAAHGIGGLVVREKVDQHVYTPSGNGQVNIPDNITPYDSPYTTRK